MSFHASLNIVTAICHGDQTNQVRILYVAICADPECTLPVPTFQKAGCAPCLHPMYPLLLVFKTSVGTVTMPTTAVLFSLTGFNKLYEHRLMDTIQHSTNSTFKPNSLSSNLYNVWMFLAPHSVNNNPATWWPAVNSRVWTSQTSGLYFEQRHTVGVRWHANN